MAPMTVKSCYLPYFSWSVEMLCSATAAAMREILRLLRFFSNLWGPCCSRLHGSRDQIRGSVPISPEPFPIFRAAMAYKSKQSFSNENDHPPHLSLLLLRRADGGHANGTRPVAILPLKGANIAGNQPIEFC